MESYYKYGGIVVSENNGHGLVISLFDIGGYSLKSWGEANTRANELSLCGYTDWRLPTVKEFELIGEVASQGIGAFKHIGYPVVEYWSSDEIKNENEAYSYSFKYEFLGRRGGPEKEEKYKLKLIRAVRTF